MSDRSLDRCTILHSDMDLANSRRYLNKIFLKKCAVTEHVKLLINPYRSNPALRVKEKCAFCVQKPQTTKTMLKLFLKYILICLAPIICQSMRMKPVSTQNYL